MSMSSERYPEELKIEARPQINLPYTFADYA